MLQPLSKRILLEPVLHDPTEPPKLIISAKVESPSKYKVIAIGEDVKKVQAGDIVFMEYSKTIFDGDTAYTFVQEENIIAKFKV